jgi:hypothetical protein
MMRRRVAREEGLVFNHADLWFKNSHPERRP